MKTIPLNHGKVAIVDDEDYERLSRFHWGAVKGGSKHFSTFYACNYQWSEEHQQSRPVYMHHAVLGKKVYVDHKNRNGLDNRKENLRPTSRSLNLYNCVKTTHKQGKPVSSRFKGVSRYSSRGCVRWRAEIGDGNGGRRRLGSFTNEEDAARAYDKAARETAGEFAVLNLPEEAS